MHDWKQSGHHFGIQLQRNVQALTDLRFADDILLFALSLQQILEMLSSLVVYLRQVGLVLNASKTKFQSRLLHRRCSWQFLSQMVGLSVVDGW